MSSLNRGRTGTMWKEVVNCLRHIIHGVIYRVEVAPADEAKPRKRRELCASTAQSSNLEESALRIQSLRTNGKCCCCTSRCTGKIWEDINSCFCCCAKQHIGEMLVLVEKKDGTPVVIAGPSWPMCIFCTVPIIVVGGFLITYFILMDNENVPFWIIPIYLSLVIASLLSLFFVGCRDPGLMERCTDEEAAVSGWFWNEQVGSFRPSNAAYCRECKVLIQDYDHVCPWTGTAIGKGNMVAFRFFLVLSNVLCYSSVSIVVYYALKGVNE